ncbi:MAG: hypothetical protein ACFUZC_11245 [Chthoniobacteraceae bacterium]
MIHCPPCRALGFSIIEVVLALGIAAFALVSVVGLLPLGLGMAEESVDESGAVNLVSSVVSDRLVTSSTVASLVYGLPAMTSSAVTLSGTFGAGENGEFIGNDLTKARYRVVYLLTAPATGRSDPWTAWFRVTWPAMAPKNASLFETVVTFPQS